MMMNGVWSRPPAGRIMRIGDGDLGEKISEGAGESLFVCKLKNHPGWLYKAYRSPSADDSVARLDRLIGLPAGMTTPDQAIVDQHTAWPAARVINAAGRTTGVLLPMAPKSYQFEMALTGGRSVRKYLEVDHLAQAPARQQQVGLPAQSLADRISVCASIASTADLLARFGLVYLDWSYANIFWCPADHSAYLIDLDGSSFGPRPQIQTPLWEDPQVPLGTTAGNTSDRYRVALLIASCLTGQRVHEAQAARTQLIELRKQSAEVEQLAELLLVALTTNAADRPTIAKMKGALDAVDRAARPAPPTSTRRTGTPRTSSVVDDRGGVSNWKPIGGRSATTAQPTTQPTAKPATQPTARPTVTPPVSPVTPGPATVKTGSSPSWQGATVGGGTRSGMTGGVTGRASGNGAGSASGYQARTPASYQSRTPAKPGSNTGAVVAKTAVAIVVLIIIIVILANL
jgi:hypothetical protein